MPSIIELDPSQYAVASANADDRLFVVASAGQGKTEVLVERIKFLEEEGLNPSDEILILSFSRAAIEAVRLRARQAGFQGISIMTFDSFASRLIQDEGGEPASGFNARIRQAVELLHGPDVPSLIERISHVLIDEAQDLVGDRAEMVLAILDALETDSGFTILGDPLQGIYDFQLKESVAKTTSSELFERIIHKFDAETTQLESHYRATTKEMRALQPIADLIRSFDETPDGAIAAHQLLDEYLPMRIGDSFLEETGVLEPIDGRTTALLAATNFEVLMASELLWKKGIEHKIRRRAQDMSLAPWIHTAFGDLPARTYPAGEILDRLAAIEGIDPDEMWRHLKLTEGNLGQRGSINFERFNRRLRALAVPLPLTVRDDHRLIVSTVHRSKGLEFSNVIYLPPQDKTKMGEKNWPTLRQKYVALSRAREKIVPSRFPAKALPPHKSSTRFDRWIEEKFWGRGKRVPFRLEFGNSDIDDTVPYVHPDFSVSQVRIELLRNDLMGIEINGELDKDSIYEGATARYILSTSNGIPIGRTSQGFGLALKHTFQRHGLQWQWPTGFAGARVTSLETTTGNAEETEAAGLGSSGMWLVPRLTGLVRPIWN